MTRPTLLKHLRVCALAASPVLALVSGESALASTTDHELGWVCFRVDDVRVAQVSAYNKDAGRSSTWVPKQRLHIEAEDNGPGGRVCAPAVVRIGSDDYPEQTFIFERDLKVGGVSKPSIAEVVLTPSSPDRTEVTLSLIGTERNWTQREGVWTFEHPRQVTFPQRTVVGLSTQEPSGDPALLFQPFVEALSFEEPCQAITLKAETPFHPANLSKGKVRASGQDPKVLAAGSVLSICADLAQSSEHLASAKGVRGQDKVEWGLIPRDALYEAHNANLRFTSEAPLGGYALCEEPQWQSATLMPLEGQFIYQLGVDQRWSRGISGLPTFPEGTPVTVIAQRSDWAFVQTNLEGRSLHLALPARALELPTGPVQDGVTHLRGESCKYPRGQWRALKANSQTHLVREGALGSEVGQSWRELPQGTQLLQLCQGGERTSSGKTSANLFACEPYYATKANAENAERYTLARYAGALIAVREHDLRDRSSGEFKLRQDRSWLYNADTSVKRDEYAEWGLSAGLGSRLSFLRSDDHGWNVGIRVERLSEEAFTFVGGVGLGGDARYTYLTLEGGIAKQLHRFPDLPLELHGLATAILDLGLDHGGGGLHILVHPRLSLRWLNEVVPLRLEAGVQFGFAPLAEDEFGDQGELQMNFTLGLQAEIIRF